MPVRRVIAPEPESHARFLRRITEHREAALADPRRIDALGAYRRVYGMHETTLAAQLSQHACHLLRADAALLGLRDPGEVTWYGAVHCTPPAAALHPERTLADWTVVAGRPLFYDDITGFPIVFEDAEAMGWRSAASMPLLIHGVVVGALLVGRTTGIPWGTREREALDHWMAMHAIINERRLGVPRGTTDDREAALARIGVLFASVAIPTVFVDADGRYAWVNEAFCSLAGRTEAALLGSPVRSAIQPYRGDPTGTYLEEMLAGHRRGYTVERRLLRPDGTERRVRILTAQLRYEFEGRHAHVAIFEDITDQPDADRVLRAREEQLVRAQRRDSMSELAGGLAHEFSNTLAAITGYASLLRDDLDPNDPRWSDADEILRITERSRELTGRLLEMGEERVPERAVLDLPAVLRDFASVARRVLPTTIEWRLEVPEEEMRARIDRVQVEEALLGLVVNARDAMPAGGELTVVLSSVTETGADGTAHRLARIALSDTGPGVPAADVERLWTPYFTTKAAGMGLGLSFGLAILREHGGDLRLESMPGAGATFAAYLPLVEARTPRAASPAAARPPLAQPHASRTVLFVEDEPAVRVTTARLLERSGFRVIAVEHGEEAWERFEANPRDIDALVTDLQMPRMSGAELIKRVRQHHSRLPVVVTSAFPSDDTTDRELRTPYTATLRKPFPVSTLIETLRALLVPAG